MENSSGDSHQSPTYLLSEDVIDILLLLKPNKGSKEILQQALLGIYTRTSTALSGRMSREQIHEIRFDPDAFRIVKGWIEDQGDSDGEEDTMLSIEHLPFSRHVYIRAHVRVFERIFQTKRS